MCYPKSERQARREDLSLAPPCTDGGSGSQRVLSVRVAPTYPTPVPRWLPGIYNGAWTNRLGRAATPAHQQSSQTEPRGAAATACHVSHPTRRSRLAPLPQSARRREQQSTLPVIPSLVARPRGALRVWWRGVPKGRPRRIGRLWGDRETGKGRLGWVGTLRPPCPGGCIGRVAGSGRRSGGQRARKGGGVWRAPGRRPGVGWPRGGGSRGRPGVARHGAGSLHGRVSGIRRLAGKHRLGAGLRGSNVSHGDRGASERSRRESSVGCGADRHARGQAVGQREGRCPRGDRLRLWRVCRGVRRQLLLLRVPAGLLRRCRLAQDLLQLLHPDPAQVGQLPHHGKLLEKGLQGHLALQELLSHFLRLLFDFLAFHLQEIQQHLRMHCC